METKSFSASEQQIKQIITTYKQYQQTSKNPYIRFFAKTKNLTISIYTSNKVVMQGEINDSNILTKKLDDTSLNQLQLGSDEVGCGDIFGPVVASCVWIENKQQKQTLKQMGFDDSKKLSDQKIISLAQKIIDENLCKYSVYVLDNENYNTLIKQMNQNELKMFVHLQARSKFANDISWIIDQFSTLNTLTKYQENLYNKKLIKNKFEFCAQTKAESKFLAVAIASILARYYFLRKMYVLSQEVNETLLLGSSNNTLKQFKKLQNEYDMNKYAKLNFKNLK